VRQNIHHFGATNDNDLYIILSGDQLYRMNLEEVVAEHDAAGAEVTITAKPVGLSEAPALGLMRINEDLEITEFVEKPSDPAVIDGLKVGESVRKRMSDPGEQDYCLASMGIYVFNAKILKDSLDSDTTDFGKEIIPSLLGKVKMQSYVFDDYWEDIGTVKAFFEANLRLTEPVPPFNFYDEEARIYTRARYLPASKINGSFLERAVVGDGAIVTNARLKGCSLGVRSVVRDATTLEDVVMMGADAYETLDEMVENRQLGRPDVGVGQNCMIRNAIIDKNVRIGNDVILDPAGLPEKFGAGVDIAIRDGVLVVCKDVIVPDGFVMKA
jgi:glucose-1-phosphate adenylyltransferase